MEEHAIIHHCENDELRCLCGSLVARLVEGGLELKCKRCKRLQLIPVTGHKKNQ